MEYKKIKPLVGDIAKIEISHFMSTLVKENRNEFLAFRNETDRLDEFFWKYIGSKVQFKSLRKLFQIVLILSHGQEQVKPGFTINKQLLDDNLSSEILAAQRIVHDHMLSHNIKPYQIEINSRMMELVKKYKGKRIEEAQSQCRCPASET